MSDWASVERQLGTAQMRGVDIAFLDQQISQGKTFIFTSNPELAPLNSYTQLGYRHLLDAGYRFQLTPEGFYRGIR
jgi:hypothetical protein